MKGLMYKDFLCIKGKWYLAFLAVQFMIVIAASCVFDGGDEMGLLVCAIVEMFYCVAICYSIFFQSQAVVSTDRGHLSLQYVRSLPIKKEGYVFAKYIYVLMMILLMTAVFAIEFSVCHRVVDGEQSMKQIQFLQKTMPFFVAFFILSAAVEMPLLFRFGGRLTKVIMGGFMVAGFFILLVYLLFGDLTLLDKLDIEVFLDFYQNNKDIFRSFAFVLPLVSCGIYALSMFLAIRSERNYIPTER